MTHHFFNHFLCLVTLICLLNPTLSAGDCAKCKESLGQSDISNNEIDGILSEKCPICQDILDQTNVSDPVIELECKHVLHKQCLIQLFDSDGNSFKKRKCPLCRAVIPQDKFYLPTDKSDEAFLAFVKDKLPSEEYQNELNKKEPCELRRKKETAEQKKKYEKQKKKFEEQQQKHEELKNPKFQEKNKKYVEQKQKFEQQKQKYEEQIKLEEGYKKYGNYVNILYEHLFNVFLEGHHDQKLAQQLPPLQFKIFHREKAKYKKLIDVVNSLSMISDFLFNPSTRSDFENKFELVFHYWREPILENEEELGEKYGMKTEEGEGTSKGQNEKEKGTKDNFMKNINHLFKKEKSSQTEKEKIGKLMGKEAAREKFDKIMEKMSEIAKTLTKKDRKMMQKIIWQSPFLPE